MLLVVGHGPSILELVIISLGSFVLGVEADIAEIAEEIALALPPFPMS